ncbi:MAG: ABC-2 transporter permease [Dysosmobacter sp.]
MKALLLKDWYVLRKQAWSYLLIVLVWGLIPSRTLNLLAVVYGAMIPYTAMAYDQRSRWDRFARMLPYSDRTVVLSRYALGWISLLLGAACCCHVPRVSSPVSRSRQSCPPTSPPACIRRPVRWVSAAGSERIPLMLRYGTEKARWVSILITFLAFASVGALNGLVNDAKTVAAAVLSLTLAGMLVLTIIATAVSIPLSLKFYRENR